MPSANPGRPPAPLLPHAAPPVDLPRGYVGPARLPGSGQLIYWTGRVAIGLRHQSRAPEAEDGAAR